MQIKKGQDRIVFVFPSLKIAVKFPIIYFVLAFFPELLRVAFKINVKTGIEYAKRYFTRFGHSQIKRFLFKGLHDNWSEFIFYWKTKNPFLQPTYFSLFGFINIQLYGELCPMESEDIWRQLRTLTNDDVMNNPHHFRESCNFCLRSGKLRILDYGDRKTQEVVLRQGTKIVEFFNLEYHREKSGLFPWRWNENEKKFVK